jgi:LysM repeat protein
MINKKTFLIALLFLMVTQVFSQDAKKYTTYVVKSGETLKSIARKIGCKTKVIKNLNPDVSKTPSVNTTLVVPNKNYGKKITPKKKIKTEKVITHMVKKGEGFYAIAKKYNVTIQSIKDANPSVAEGLQPGQRIRIPNKSEFTIQPETGKVVFYKVKKGDTKWNIAALHKISVTELDKINPQLKGELKEGDNIWVPTSNETEQTNEPPIVQEKDPSFIYHVVKQGEGLFRIAVMYSTTQDKIEKLNPEATKKLRPGMILKIPGKKKDKFLTHKVIKGDTFFNLTHTYDVSKSDLKELNPELKDGLKLGMIIKIKMLPKPLENRFTDSISTGKILNISFLMPLMSEENIDLNSKNKSKLRNICTDFYMGAEIAIDSLRKQGLQINYHVYDTKNNPTYLYQLLKDENLKASDVIIGPFFFDNARIVAQELSHLPIITPIYSKKQITDSHENLIKAAIDDKELTESLLNYLKENYTHQKIIIATDDNSKNKSKGKFIGDFFKKQDSIVNIQYITPLHNKNKPEDIYMDKEVLQESIIEKKATWIIMVSETPVIISDIVNTYGVMANDEPIRLFTTQALKNFDYVDYEYLSQLNWTFPSAQFDLLASDAVDLFRNKYQRINHTIPSAESHTGFDLTYDILLRLSSNNTFITGLEAGISTRLSHQFNYIKSAKGDYRNHGVIIVGFDKEMSFKILN